MQYRKKKSKYIHKDFKGNKKLPPVSQLMVVKKFLIQIECSHVHI